MKPSYCQRESQSVAAAGSGKWTPELRAHVAQCPSCAEAVLVAEFLRQDLGAAEAMALPSAGQVWWIAQIRARRADAERVVQPVRLVSRISAACALLGAVLLVVRLAPDLQHWLQQVPWQGEEPLVWVFVGTAATVVAAVSAGLGYMRHSSK